MCMKKELNYMAPLDILVVVGLRAHVWYICGCWPSCHVWYIYMVVDLRAMFGIYVVVGICAMFFAGFGNLPVQGRCCRNFESTLTIFAHFCRRRTCGRDLATPIVFFGAAGLPAPR
jgi:hypothetical protein